MLSVPSSKTLKEAILTLKILEDACDKYILAHISAASEGSTLENRTSTNHREENYDGGGFSKHFQN
jgi:hypothetical protein